MEEPTQAKSSGSDFKTFFIRGLAIVLPTVLTIWLLVIAYSFVSERIADPINAGLREIVLRFTDFPAPLSHDYALAFGRQIAANPRLESAWRQHAERRERALGIERMRAATLQKERILWAQQQPAIVLAARRIAFENRWDSYWGLLDIIGLIIAVILIYIAGVLVTSFLGRRLYRWGEGLIGRVPLIRNVYPSVKQVTDFFFSADTEKIAFNRVVAVQYPRKGMWSVGMVTGRTMQTIEEAAQAPCLTVFIPSSPTPFTGYVITVPRADTVDLPINIEDAMKFTVSGGVVIPKSQLIESSPNASERPKIIEAGPTERPQSSFHSSPQGSPMTTTVSGRHLEITDAIRDYAQKKTVKMDRLCSQLQKVEVVADKRDSHTFVVELIAHVDGHEHFVAHGQHEDLYACIDQVCDKLERQLAAHKEKLVQRHHGG